MASDKDGHMCHGYPLMGNFHLGVGIRTRMDGEWKVNEVHVMSNTPSGLDPVSVLLALSLMVCGMLSLSARNVVRRPLCRPSHNTSVLELTACQDLSVSSISWGAHSIGSLRPLLAAGLSRYTHNLLTHRTLQSTVWSRQNARLENMMAAAYHNCILSLMFCLFQGCVYHSTVWTSSAHTMLSKPAPSKGFCELICSKNWWRNC